MKNIISKLSKKDIPFSIDKEYNVILIHEENVDDISELLIENNYPNILVRLF